VCGYPATAEPYDPYDPFARLLDTLHYDSKLYLVFEFLDNDLKRYQEAMNAAHTPLTCH
jgi:cyclin-dependent kinase